MISVLLKSRYGVLLAVAAFGLVGGRGKAKNRARELAIRRNRRVIPRQLHCTHKFVA